MTEWTVFLVIVAVIGLFVTVGTPVIKLNSSITTLCAQINNLQSCITDLKISNKDAHKRIWEHIDECNQQIISLQNEITIIKAKSEENEN